MLATAAPGGTWDTVVDATRDGETFTAATRRFDAPSAGTWQFRARLIKTSTSPDKTSGFSPTMSVTAT